jgi:hypothetical protein
MKKQPKQQKPQQSSLFGAAPTPTSPASEENALLKINASDAKLSPAQKTFNRLLEQIAAARKSLEDWITQAKRLHERQILEVAPAEAQLRQLQLAVILKVDALLLSPPKGLKLTANRKRAMTRYILSIVDQLLEFDPDNSELHALHDRHSEEDLATIRKMDREMELGIAEDMLKTIFGEKMVNREGVDDFEELIKRTHERVEQAEVNAPPPKRSKREQAAEDKRKTAEEALSQSLREIYRKLASSLHPDRETDPELRAQKTVLMQRINIAYQAKDLLALLTLQLEVEQISAATLGQVPEQRLAQYNQILREQLQTLKAQQTDLLEELFERTGAQDFFRAPKAADFDSAITQQKQRALRVIESLKYCHAQLSDPNRLQAAIDEIVDAIKQQDKEDRQAELEEARMSRYFDF